MQTTNTPALVTATFSRRMEVTLASGEILTARIKGKKLRAVCGDRVIVQSIPNEPEWLIVDVLPRENELARPNSRGQIEILAANITFICVVTADPPAPDWFIVDRYLCAAEIMSVPAAVVFNKSDLDGNKGSSREVLENYEALGYSILRCSAHSGVHIERLRMLLSGHTAIIVGQSGVGKSTLINCLVRNADLRTARVSESTGEGRHTTVNSVMLSLGGGGAVIDSPGVRDYAPATMSAEDVIRGFREIRDAGLRCRFANCRHLREPDCAVKSAVDDASITGRRYESYKRLQALTARLASDRGK